jgi:hypothetical protein
LAKEQKKSKVVTTGIRPPLTIGTFCRFIFCCVAHLSYVGFVPLGDLLGNIGEELKIQKLPAKVSGVILIYFRSQSCRAGQLSTPPATFAFLVVELIPPHVSLVTLMTPSEIHRDDGQHHSPPHRSSLKILSERCTAKEASVAV